MSKYTPDEIRAAKEGFHFIRVSPTAEVKRYKLVDVNDDGYADVRSVSLYCDHGHGSVIGLNEAATERLINGYYRSTVFWPEGCSNMDDDDVFYRKIDELIKVADNIHSLRIAKTPAVAVQYMGGGNNIALEVDRSAVITAMLRQMEAIISTVLSPSKEPQ